MRIVGYGSACLATVGFVALLWASASADPACSAIGAIHVHVGTDSFEIALPDQVRLRAPGSIRASFWVDLGANGGPRLDYDEPSGVVEVRNGILVGSGKDWKVYPDSAACRELAEGLGGATRVQVRTPGDPRALPPNGITVDHEH